MEPTQKPSIGRVIVYNNPGSKDGTYPPTQSPGIVVKVNEDGTVWAHVFTTTGMFIHQKLEQGDGPCQWNWPARV